MKIIRIIARLNVGGPAQHVVWLTSRMSTLGHDSLLVVGAVPTGEADMMYFADRHDVRPIEFKEMSRELSPRDAIVIWKLFRLFRRERPDVIHTHTAKAGTVGRVAALLYRVLSPATLIGRGPRVAVIHTYHGHVFHGYYSPLLTRFFLTIERMLARIATDRIVVISPEQRDEIHRKYGVGRDGQFAVVRLGLDLGVFDGWETRRAAARGTLGVGDERVVVGIVGRLTEIKDHALFLRAAAALVRHGGRSSPTRFVIVGDGHLRDTLVEQARLLDLGDSVAFMGSRDDMSAIYPGFDIVALTSANEGTPLTLIESLANARPVVAMNVGGVADILGRPAPGESPAGAARREHGLLVQRRDADAFAAALSFLIDRPVLRQEMGARGQGYVQSTYALDRLSADLSQLYAAAIAE